MSKICNTCGKISNIDTMISDRKIITKTGYASSGCTIKTYYWCSIKCVPELKNDYPPSNTGMVVGEIINM